MTNIFIANLDFEITSEDLKATFSQFGEVHYAHVVFDNKTKKSKGFGYVEMPVIDNAIAAIEALNGLEVNGRALDVKIASPKDARPAKKEFVKKEFKQKPFSSNKPKFSSNHKKPVVVNNDDSADKPKRVMRPRRKRL
jgi:RNA recognition motif-containing protein